MKFLHLRYNPGGRTFEDKDLPLTHESKEQAEGRKGTIGDQQIPSPVGTCLKSSLRPSWILFIFSWQEPLQSNKAIGQSGPYDFASPISTVLLLKGYTWTMIIVCLSKRDRRLS